MIKYNNALMSKKISLCPNLPKTKALHQHTLNVRFWPRLCKHAWSVSGRSKIDQIWCSLAHSEVVARKILSRFLVHPPSSGRPRSFHTASAEWRTSDYADWVPAAADDSKRPYRKRHRAPRSLLCSRRDDQCNTTELYLIF